MPSNISVDFSQVPTMDPLPPGDYPVIVSEVEVRDSQSSEHQYLNWELEVTEGEYAGRKQWLMTSFSPKALWRLRAVLINLGVYQDNMEFAFDEDTNTMIAPEVTGLPAVARLIEDTYKGEVRSRVDTLLAPNGEDLSARKRTNGNSDKPGPARGKAALR